MNVIKRNGTLEEVSFDKVLNRIKKVCFEAPLLTNVNYFDIAQKVCARIFDGVKTSELDELAAQICSSMILEHPEYGTLGARLIISNHQKNTSPSFSETVMMLYNNEGGSPVVSEDFYNIVMANREKLNNSIDYSRDYLLDYFGFKTLERAYLLKVNDKVIERPQHLFLRVAIGIHKNDIKDALETYDLMSQKYFTHATPTLFNAGTKRQQLSSCFLQSINGDSIDGIFDSIKESAMISKYAGGIGIHVHDVRSKGSVIRGTNGKSDGIIPMLKVFNQTARYVNQAGRRAGSIAVYIEPWHADIFEFLQLKRPHGNEEDRARDLFYALWIPDLFMKRVKENGKWSLMCPDECKGLSDTHSKEFEELYTRYEMEGKYRKQIDAQELWFKILECQIESGVPYLLYKDACNQKSNQKNLGTIKSSNLCVAPETMILTSNGYYKIKELENHQVNIWNGEEFTKTKIQKTGNNQELIKVKLSNGSELECTPYHKFYIATGKRPSQYPKIKQIEAKDLKKDMTLIKSDFPIIKDGLSDFPHPYEHGLFSADGTLKNKKDTELKCSYKSLRGKCYCARHIKMYEEKDEDLPTIYCKAIVGRGHPRISLYGEKKKLLKHISSRLEVQSQENNKTITVRLPMELKPKFEVPINYNMDIKLKWLEGLVDGDGCICKSDNLTGIQIASIDKQFLENVKYMLQTLGCDPKIVLLHEEAKRLLPNQKGGYELYNCKDCYRLLITSWDTAKLYELGFRPKRLKLTGVYPKNNTKRWVKVDEIIETNRISDTYCFKEEKRGMGIFNGILTGQCTEILEYSSPEETAVCNLASICLPSFVERDEETNQMRFNFEKLHAVTKVVTKNLNKVIDINFYPVEKARRSNLRHRPIGIGVQGLADTYVLMRHPFDSEGAKMLNEKIFETIYHAAVERSMELAEKMGPYETFSGSPASEGQLQFDLWGKIPSDSYNWDSLKERVKQVGLRNSLMIAPMPTASTSQIMGFNECFEPFTSNLYKRKTMAGEFILVNKYLINDLIELGLWNKDLKDKIMISDGSIQGVDGIPDEIKSLYKTVWEIKQKVLIDQAADRGKYICQSQSMNLFIEDPDFKKLSSMHFYSWSSGLKTGLYYLRSKPKAKQQKFTIDPNLQKFANVNKKEDKDKGDKGNDKSGSSKQSDKKAQQVECTDEICVVCSS